LALFADSVNDLGAEIFAQQDANLNATARAAARDNEGKPGAAGKEPCPDAGGRGANRAPNSSSNTTAEAPDPRNPRHHIFPQQFRSQFESAGIDIDEYTVEMTQEEHQALHSKGWNDEWGDFFDENPNASPGQIRDFAGELLNEAGFASRPIVPYY
jgi:Predicted lipoprotein of unknown function (DUF2380)